MNKVQPAREPDPTDSPVAVEVVTDLEARPNTPRELFTRMDHELIRVLEDLVYVLIEKGVITLQELPEHAQAKLLDRRGFRERIQNRQRQKGEFIDVLDDSKFGLLR